MKKMIMDLRIAYNMTLGLCDNLPLMIIYSFSSAFYLVSLADWIAIASL